MDWAAFAQEALTSASQHNKRAPSEKSLPPESKARHGFLRVLAAAAFMRHRIILLCALESSRA